MTFSDAKKLAFQNRRSFHEVNEPLGADRHQLRGTGDYGFFYHVDLVDLVVPRLTALTKLTVECSSFFGTILHKYQSFWSQISPQLRSFSLLWCAGLEQQQHSPDILRESLASCHRLNKLKLMDIDHSLAKILIPSHISLEELDLDMRNFPQDDDSCRQVCIDWVNFIVSAFPKLKKLRLSGRGSFGTIQ